MDIDTHLYRLNNLLVTEAGSLRSKQNHKIYKMEVHLVSRLIALASSMLLLDGGGGADWCLIRQPGVDPRDVLDGIVVELEDNDKARKDSDKDLDGIGYIDAGIRNTLVDFYKREVESSTLLKEAEETRAGILVDMCTMIVSDIIEKIKETLNVAEEHDDPDIKVALGTNAYAMIMKAVDTWLDNHSTFASEEIHAPGITSLNLCNISTKGQIVIALIRRSSKLKQEQARLCAMELRLSNILKMRHSFSELLESSYTGICGQNQ
jgi:hypothetical protein